MRLERTIKDEVYQWAYARIVQYLEDICQMVECSGSLRGEGTTGGRACPGGEIWPSIRRETRSFYGEEIQDLSNLFQFLRTGRRGTIYERLRKALPDSPALALGRIRSSPRRRSTMSVISISVLSANPLMHLVTL